MTIFSGKVVSAKFIDPPNNMLIELLYREDDSVIPYVLEVDFTSEDFNALLQELTLEEIEETTGKELKAEQQAFESIVQREIEKRWAEEQDKIKAAYDDAESYAQKVIEREYNKINAYAEVEKSKKFQEVQEEFQKARSELQTKFNLAPTSNVLDGKDIFAAIDQNNQDNDFVFNLKVSILEDPIIAKSRDKKLKLAIRKSKSVLELLKIYAEAKEAA